MTQALRLIAMAALAFVLVGCSGTGGTRTEDRVLPDAQFEELDGSGTYALRQTGTPRALNLWATWCAPCRAELPAFDEVAGRVEGAEIVGINVGDSGPDAAELVQELGLDFRQVLDPKATVQQTLRITGMPATVFVDAQGDIVKVHAGELDASELETLLADLFGATFRSE